MCEVDYMNSDYDFTEVYSSIGSGNGLAPANRQAIVWPNDG